MDEAEHKGKGATTVTRNISWEMAVEIISWQNLDERYGAGPEDRTSDLQNTSRMAYPNDLAGPANNNNNIILKL